MTGFAEYLQSKYESGEILHYLVTKVPSGSLPTGWIEKGLVSKGVTGSIESKKNQEHLAIPLDRFARLVKDLDLDNAFSILLAGEKGLHNPRLVSIVSNSLLNGAPSALCFWPRDLGILHTIDLVFDNGPRVSDTPKSSESVIDYVEELRSDYHSGEVSGFITLKIPKGRFKVSEWIHLSKKSPHLVSTDGFHGNVPSFIRVCAKWLSTFQLLNMFKSGVASILFVNSDMADLCMWDASQGFASFARLRGSAIRTHLEKYLQSLWMSESDLASSISAPEVIIEGRGKAEPRRKTPQAASVPDDDSMAHEVRKLSSRLSAIPVKDFEHRLQRIENRAGSDAQGEQSYAILTKRLEETANLLEGLSKRLKKLESRLERIGIAEER